MKILIDGQERNTPIFTKTPDRKDGTAYTAFIGSRVIQFSFFADHEKEFSLNIYTCRPRESFRSGIFEKADEITNEEFNQAYQNLVNKLPRIFGIKELLINNEHIE